MTDVATWDGQPVTSLHPGAARQLATTKKSVPQAQEISSRWLLRALSWVEVTGGTYRVNRRLVTAAGDGRVSFVTSAGAVRVMPQALRELALLRDLDDDEVLRALADRFVQQEVAPGEVVAERGEPADRIVLIAHGKLQRLGVGKYGAEVVLAVLAEGDQVSQPSPDGAPRPWPYTVRALTATTVLTLSQADLDQVLARSESLRRHVEGLVAGGRPRHNRYGEAAIDLASGHAGEPELPRTFVDYDPAPRQYELSVAQTVLRVHSRVGDLFNEPMDQTEQQLRLTVHALRERQEADMVNNPSFGLLHNVDPRQRLSTRAGPPAPADMDDILARRRSTHFYFAHPLAIAAFGRECTRRGVYPDTVELLGTRVHAWRGVPILPCNKIPVTSSGTTSILVLRTGEEKSGVVGLHQTGLPDEHEPGLNVRFMDVDAKGVRNYLVSAYYSVAVLVPDALGVLENVQVGR